MSKALSTHVALLRGINVGGNNMLPMKDLAAMFADAGCKDVRTYIQSGNVVFRGTPTLIAALAAVISAQIEARFRCRIPVVLRSEAEIHEILASNPFPGPHDKTMHVFFLAAKPSAEAAAALDPNRSPPDRFIVRGREIYAQLPNGARSKLSNAWFDSRLSTVSTARNWNTVLKLAELMKQP